MSHSILSSQNTAENLSLLQASSVAYSKSKSGENAITYLLLLLSFAYPIVYLELKNDEVKMLLFGFSFCISVTISLLSGSFKTNTYLGALFKEEFDTRVFNLPWKSTIQKADRREVLQLALQYKGWEVKDWYSSSLNENVNYHSSIAIHQYTNTWWDIELRRYYQCWLASILIFHSLFLLIFLFYVQPNFLTIFLLLFSLLSFYTHFINIIKGNAEVIQKRIRLALLLDYHIRNKNKLSTSELRDIQDEIFLTRQHPIKVPDHIYKKYQKKLNAAIERYMEEVNNLY